MPITAVAAPGTSPLQSKIGIDFEDCLVDDVRVVLYGSHNTGFASQVTIYDLTDGKELCRAAIPAVLSFVFGDWVRISPSAGDHELELRVIGDGVDVQTLYSVHLQCRTLTL